MNLLLHRLIFLSFLLVFGQGLLWSRPIDSPASEFEESANLALRRIGHQLLAEAGDPSSALPPVQRLKDGTFYLPLQTAIDYEALRLLVDESLQAFGLPLSYQLTLYECEAGTLALGYLSQPGEEEPPACSGREQLASCYNLAIRFPDQPAKDQMSSSPWWLSGIIPLLLLTAYFYQKKEEKGPEKFSHEPETGESEQVFKLGSLTADIKNQMVYSREDQQPLTYQEAQVLHLLCRRMNQAISREEILREAWGNEQLIVGRSIDVFISRLRKLLKPEPQIHIASVYGVGYRMEWNMRQKVK